MVSDAAGIVFDDVADVIERAALGGKTSMRDMVDGILADLERLAVRKFIIAPLEKLFGNLFEGLFGGARAEGGPVAPGRAFLVGEEGPELFVPRVCGTHRADGPRRRRRRRHRRRQYSRERRAKRVALRDADRGHARARDAARHAQSISVSDLRRAGQRLSLWMSCMACALASSSKRVCFIASRMAWKSSRVLTRGNGLSGTGTLQKFAQRRPTLGHVVDEEAR